jgi:hypothetical protein
VTAADPPAGSSAEEATRRLARAAALAAFAGQLAFAACWIAASALESGYSPLRQYISELGRHGAAHPLLMNVGIAVLGISLVLAGVAAFASLPPGRPRVVLLVLLAAGGVLIGLASLFRIDCSVTTEPLCRHRWDHGELPAAPYVHYYVTAVGEGLLVLSPFAAAWALRPSRLSVLATGCGAVGVLYAVISFVTFHAQERAHVLGAVQRFGTQLLAIWVGLIAAWVLSGAGASRPAHAAR